MRADTASARSCTSTVEGVDSAAEVLAKFCTRPCGTTNPDTTTTNGNDNATVDRKRTESPNNESQMRSNVHTMTNNSQHYPH